MEQGRKDGSKRSCLPCATMLLCGFHIYVCSLPFSSSPDVMSLRQLVILPRVGSFALSFTSSSLPSLGSRTRPSIDVRARRARVPTRSPHLPRHSSAVRSGGRGKRARASARAGDQCTRLNSTGGGLFHSLLPPFFPFIALHAGKV